MKATIEFHDDRELIDAINGWKWKNAMWELDQQMRKVTKHGHHDGRDATEDEINITEYWRETLRKLINNDGLNFE